MTAKKLEDEAWRLIEAAKFAVEPSRRRMLIQDAFELIKKARALRDRNPGLADGVDDAPEGYRLWFSRFDGATLWIDLRVENRPDALWATDALAAACSEQYEDFELWQGSRYLFGGETRHSRFSMNTGIEVTLASQQSVLETEEALLRSHQTLARSAKLLRATQLLRSILTAGSVH